jgi:hypothetical protein
VDLNDVTLIDREGEKLLRAMSKEGAHFVANNVYIKHVLAELKASGRCGLSAIIASFFAALFLSVIASGLSAQMGSAVGEMNLEHGARTRMNSSTVAHVTNSRTHLLREREDQDYAGRFPTQDR